MKTENKAQRAKSTILKLLLASHVKVTKTHLTKPAMMCSSKKQELYLMTFTSILRKSDVFLMVKTGKKRRLQLVTMLSPTENEEKLNIELNWLWLIPDVSPWPPNFPTIQRGGMKLTHSWSHLASTSPRTVPSHLQSPPSSCHCHSVP